MKSRTFLPLFLLGLSAAACDQKPVDRVEVSNTPADNSKKNERDRGYGTLTPGDQGENEVDRGITQRIRQEIIKTGGLSMNAKNIKVITVASVVTLRGPVSNDQERSQIVAIAQQVDGVKRVENQIEIAAN